MPSAGTIASGAMTAMMTDARGKAMVEAAAPKSVHATELYLNVGSTHQWSEWSVAAAAVLQRG